MADGSITHQTLRPHADVPLFKCCVCKVPTYLADLNEEMQCLECGPADLDPEGFAPSEGELRRDNSTWSA